jgi:hypothetical protein
MRPNKSAAPGSSSSGSTSTAKLEGLDGAFHFQKNERPGERQNCEIAFARARVVCGWRSFFAYIEKCPYCSREHVHDRTRYYTSINPWKVLERDGGLRKAQCSTRMERRLYRILVEDPPLFTANGTYNSQAFRVMGALAEEFLPIIDPFWMPRSSVLLRWGDA